MRTAIILILFVCLSCIDLRAQTACIDSVRVNPTYQCNTQLYDPVCGCDNVTYRNTCNAVNNHGVNRILHSGVCSGLDVDFYPNPVGPASVFTINLSFPEFINGNADVKIVDAYGKTWEHRIVNNFNRTMIQLDMYTVMTGVYLLVVTSSLKTVTVKKFAVY